MQKNDNKGSFCTFSLFATLMMSNWRDKLCRWDTCITYLSKSYALPKYLYPHDVYSSAGGSCDWFWWYKSLYQSILFLEWQKHIWQALFQGTFFLYPSFEDCHSDSHVWACLLFGAVRKTANMLEILAIRLKPDNLVSQKKRSEKNICSPSESNTSFIFCGKNAFLLWFCSVFTEVNEFILEKKYILYVIFFGMVLDTFEIYTPEVHFKLQIWLQKVIFFFPRDM